MLDKNIMEGMFDDNIVEILSKKDNNKITKKINKIFKILKRYRKKYPELQYMKYSIHLNVERLGEWNQKN